MRPQSRADRRQHHQANRHQRAQRLTPLAQRGEQLIAVDHQLVHLVGALRQGVRHLLGVAQKLFERLVAHVRAQGHDAASRSAAADVLRYFDLAAPHHHQDEELHVLPPLLASDDATQRALAEQLVAEGARVFLVARTEDKLASAARELAENARYLAADQRKMSRNALVRMGDITEFDVVFADEAPNEAIRKKLDEAGVECVVVGQAAEEQA